MFKRVKRAVTQKQNCNIMNCWALFLSKPKPLILATMKMRAMPIQKAKGCYQVQAPAASLGS